MVDVDVDAGFAVAITIRERLLNDALLMLYLGNSFPRNQKIDLGSTQALEQAHFVGFIAPLQLSCKDNNTIVLTIPMWGSLSVVLPTVQETRYVLATLTVTLNPSFAILRKKLVLEFGNTTRDVTITGWDYTVIGPAFSPPADAYLHGTAFLTDLQNVLKSYADDIDLLEPGIDLSSLPDNVLMILTGVVQSRIVGSALLLGIDIQSDSNNVTTSGDITRLQDFARSYDIAGAVNEVAVPILMQTVKKQVSDQVSQAGATLDSLHITAQLDAFHVDASASNWRGSANISFNVIPTLFAYKPGALIRWLPKDVLIHPRTWPALGFTTADINVDEDPALWIDVVSALAGAINWTIPIAAYAILSFITYTDAAEKAQKIAAAKADLSVPRVQHLQSLIQGGPPIRVEIADLEIDTYGVYLGMTFQPQPPKGKLLGVTSIPSNYCSQQLIYSVRLPYGVPADDPKLRIRWTVYDSTGTVLLNQDDLAAGRESLTIIPEQIGPGSPQLGVTVRVYRAIGAQITDLLNDSIVLDIRGPLPPGAYVRWYYEDKNPQVQFDETNQVWNFEGYLRIKRHSNWHRTDCPCANESKRAKSTNLVETLDVLPFAIRDIALHRPELCDYCFYGGPAGERPSL